MRIRTVKPEFWKSEDIAALSWHDRLLFIGLWSYVDDNGVGRDNARLIDAELFPLDEGDSLANISRGLATLSDAGLISRYTVAGKNFLHVTSWNLHQKIDRPGKERYPLPTRPDAEPRETVAEPSRDIRDTLAPVVSSKEQGSGNRDQVDVAQSAPTKRGTRLPDDWEPSAQLLRQMAQERPDVNLRAEHVKFVDHWRAQPGQKGVKLDWDATWRNWIRNSHGASQNRKQNDTDQAFSRAAAWAAQRDQEAISQ